MGLCAHLDPRLATCLTEEKKKKKCVELSLGEGGIRYVVPLRSTCTVRMRKSCCAVFAVPEV